MTDMKAGKNMTGKFNSSRNPVCLAYSIIGPLVWLIGGAVFAVKTGLYETEFIFVIIIVTVAAIILPIFPLKKCEFSADDEKIVFREVFLKRTCHFSEIKSASTEVGFSHGRYGSSPRVELVITLSDGESVTFYDEDVPDDALSTPENHKRFQNAHQFTALCKYINERANG